MAAEQEEQEEPPRSVLLDSFQKSSENGRNSVEKRKNDIAGLSRVFDWNSLLFKGHREQRSKNREIQGHDPLAFLGSDNMSMIFSRLDARSLAQSILVSREWNALASSDCFWGKLCDELWVGKAHLPRRALQKGLSKLASYSISLLDAKRTKITKEDLCSHVWEFRFKMPAPMYWLNLDPSWRGSGPPMRRYFHPDGSQTADPTDKVWGGHECTYSILSLAAYSDKGVIREHYVRINRWPKMSVSRKPDWSWKLDNHIYCYSSIPDPYREGGTGPLFSCMNLEK
eukprot:TRINITY_DN11021_c0_g1_i2.p1 TRINITY_DN11021_c0_g1~~TRINITY_DN11021_c0_g1_i2.p1  ORF type:complete len:284 (-),score=51.44 TRINITY_DN11021_c0_g1_i2:188-1039(-)